MVGLSEERSDDTHHKCYDDHWDPSYERDSSNCFISQPHNDEWYSESDNSHREESDRECYESEESSESKIDEPKDKYKYE